MAIGTYAELKTAIAGYLARSDLTSQIPDFISLAEDRISHDLRIRAMEASADMTLTTQSTALPTGYLQMRRLYLSTDPVTKLEFVPVQNFWATWAGSVAGQPRVYTIEGDDVLVGPSPDGTYTGKALYYKKFDALSADADTNWLLSNARGLYLYGALIEASPYIRNDPRIATWSAMWDNEMDRVQKADDRDRHPETLVARPDFVGA